MISEALRKGGWKHEANRAHGGMYWNDPMMYRWHHHDLRQWDVMPLDALSKNRSSASIVY